MPSVRITPWETPENLLELGGCFYQGGRIQGDNEVLEHGCDLTDAYSRRGPLPHAVASTAGLARALVAERCLASTDACHVCAGAGGLRGTTAAHAIASMYATAFLAFVTGYLDNQQTGATKKTMFDLAETIGMPVAFVALRHAIVHEGYLGLRELRRISHEGLDWLWRNYWRSLLERPQDVVEGDGEEAEDDGAEVEHAEDADTDKILADYIAAWAAQPHPPTHNPRSPARPVDAQLNVKATATVTAMVHAKGNRSANRHATAIVGALLREEAMLAPITDMKAEKHLIVKWDPLLRSLATQLKRRFVSTLVNSLLARLLQPSLQETPLKTQSKSLRKSKSGANARMQISDDVAKPILAWIRHFCNHITWTRIIRAEITLDDLARPSLEHSSPYTTVVAVLLVRSRLWTASRRHSLEVSKAHMGKTQGTVAESLEALVDRLTKDAIPTAPDEDQSMQSEPESQTQDLPEAVGNEIEMSDDQIDQPQN